MTTAEKLVKIAENEEKVYESGRKVGTEEGKSSAYDTFWDAYQRKGGVGPQYYFGTFGWTGENFYPKYDIFGPNVGIGCFREFNRFETPFDLAERLSFCGAELNMSSATSARETFYRAGVTRVPALDFGKVTAMDTTFANAKIEAIDKLILPSDGSTTFSNVFYGCTNLKSIIIEGIIGQSGLNFKWSAALDTASLLSILTALSKDSAIAKGKSITVAKASMDIITADTECNEQLSLATDAGWTVAIPKE